MTREEFGHICKTMYETGSGGYLGPSGEPITCFDDLLARLGVTDDANDVDTMRVTMQAKPKVNIVGGPRCGGYEPMGLEMEGCTAVAWSIPCRLSDAQHVYIWDADADVWRYAGAGRHDGGHGRDDDGD